MELSFQGAAGTVTGSRYLLSAGGRQILIDCGLFQGYKQLRLRNWAGLPFDAAQLDAVILTHAHLDHSGYLPVLVRKGFKGPIYCTSATADLCHILLPDSGHLLEEEAERANRLRYTKHQPAVPLYTEAEARQCLAQLKPVSLLKDFSPAEGFRAHLLSAGHILGAAMVRIEHGGSSVLFSGDLGRPRDPIMHPPAPRPPSDFVVLESTYGDRLHSSEDAEARLGTLIRRIVKRRGVMIIPAFAVGRAQTLMHFIRRLKQRRAIPPRLPVFLNGPLSAQATVIYKRHPQEHRLAGEHCDAMCDDTHVVATVEESKALNTRKGPMVIIAGSGMASGGRVIHHLKAFAPEPNNLILLAGFQAGGTRGAALRAGAEAVKIHGAYVPVRAQVEELVNVSAHADADEILDWLRQTAQPPRQIFLTHGEAGAADALRIRIKDELGWSCLVPEHGQRVRLPAPSV